jgi:hypothetical protein
MRSSEAFISGKIHGGGLSLLGSSSLAQSNIWRFDSINLLHFLMGQRNPGVNKRNFAKFRQKQKHWSADSWLFDPFE